VYQGCGQYEEGSVVFSLQLSLVSDGDLTDPRPLHARAVICVPKGSTESDPVVKSESTTVCNTTTNK